MKQLHYLYMAATLLCMASCIEPPLHLPGQELEVLAPQVETDLTVVWDTDVDLDTDWYYGWDLTDDSIWGEIGYPIPTRYEVRRYYKGDNPKTKHSLFDAFTTNTSWFRRYFQFGYYDMLFFSDIDSEDGTQVLVFTENADSVVATTTGTRGISKGILNASFADENDSTSAIGLLNQPEIFYAVYTDNVYISSNLDDYEYDPVENVYIKHLEATLHPLVYIYLVQFILYNNEDGRIKGVNGNAALSSMASYVNVSTGCTGSVPAVVYFNTRMKKNLQVKGMQCDVIGGKLTTFGLCDNGPHSESGATYTGTRGNLKNFLYYDLVWNNNAVQTYQFEVTDQCQIKAHGGILTVWIDCSKLTPPESDESGGGSLFIPTVEDYDEVYWEIEI